jgi:hypothetical protein
MVFLLIPFYLLGYNERILNLLNVLPIFTETGQDSAH